MCKYKAQLATAVAVGRVELPPTVPVPHMDAGSFPGCSISYPTLCPWLGEGSSRRPLPAMWKTWNKLSVLASGLPRTGHCGHWRVLCLWPAPALVTVATWGVNRSMEDLILSASLSNLLLFFLMQSTLTTTKRKKKFNLRQHY